MSQGVRSITLELDLRPKKDEALIYKRGNPEATLEEFLRVYPARTRQVLRQEYYSRPLRHFEILPITLQPDEGVELKSDNRTAVKVRGTLDDLYQADVAAQKETEKYPEALEDTDAVQRAYRHELGAIADYLANGLSVLIVCDKILTEHIYEDVCKRAGKKPVLDDSAPPEGTRTPSQREQMDRAMQGQAKGGVEANLPLLIRSLKDGEILVLRSVDVLDSPPLIEVLYQGVKAKRKPQLLGFLDPSLEVKKVLTDRFAIRVSIMGLPRYIQPDPDKPPVYTVTRLVTANERACFKEFDPEGLFKNVSGLNAIQFRNAMRYVGAKVGPNSSSRDIYDVIRRFKTSSSDEIEIPDTGFDDIGGYEQVKQELKRIVMLATGRVAGLDERERQKLVPRGFIFHGPPGTGKTLFAKAIANEMNATIQMVSGPEIMDKYVGQSESNLRHIFATARRNAPSVIFFDEFDSVASQRSTYSDGGSRANNAVVAQLLTELDGFREDQAVLLIGTTNRIDIIDEALLRPSRLRPIEIGQPNYQARRSVASIHAEKFGVDNILATLCEKALEYLPAWKEQRESREKEIPPAFLHALFALHPPFKDRYEMQDQTSGFLRELQGFFNFICKAKQQQEESSAVENPALVQVENRLVESARKYGLDLTQGNLSDLDNPALLQPMKAELLDLFKLLQEQSSQTGGFTPETFVSGVMDLIASYTDTFNNDEIRAIFQESSLEYHLDGKLITPRSLGMKVGLIRKRRDERQTVHLSGARRRH